MIKTWLFIMGFFFLTIPVFAADLHRAEMLGYHAQLERADKEMRKGQSEEAAELAVKAFRVFEEGEFHHALAVKNHKLYKELEGNWLLLVKAYEQRDPVQANAYKQKLSENFHQAGTLVGGIAESSSAVTLNAFMILFREGFEALLILGSILAAFRKMKRHDLGRIIWAGAGAGILGTVGLYFLSRKVLVLRGVGREILEGITMLIAGAVLFYLSYWLISKVQGRKWQEFIQSKVNLALSRGNVLAIAMLSFLVVFREGFETVLLLRALEASSNGWLPVATGVALASVALSAAFVAIIMLGVRLPIRTFFTITSIFLLFLVFKFAGDGILELQEGGAISYHPLSWFPNVTFLKSFFGLHPSLEGLLLQCMVFIVIVLGLMWTFLWNRPSKEKSFLSSSSMAETPR